MSDIHLKFFESYFFQTIYDHGDHLGICFHRIDSDQLSTKLCTLF